MSRTKAEAFAANAREKAEVAARAELLARAKPGEEALVLLSPEYSRIDLSKPLPPLDDMFVLAKNGDVTLLWGGYEYYIHAERINSPEKLLTWLRHVGTKTWRDMTARRIAYLIDALAEHHKWLMPDT